MRCPAGDDQWTAILTTYVVACSFGVALVLFVVQRMSFVWKKIVAGEARADATGANSKQQDASGTMRIFLSWIQMMSMLASVKLQPPEALRSATDTAEVMNVSIEWFPIQCTLRLTFFMRVLVYMAMPVCAVCVPILFVYATSRCAPMLREQTARKRSAERRGVQIPLCRKLIFAAASFLSNEESVKKSALALREKESNRVGQNDFRPRGDDNLHVELDQLIDEIIEAERSLEHARNDSGLTIEDEEHDAPTMEEAGIGEIETIPSSVPRQLAVIQERGSEVHPLQHCVIELAYLRQQERRMNARNETPAAKMDADEVDVPGSRHFQVASVGRPVALRTAPAFDAEKMKLRVHEGDVIRAVEVVQNADGRDAFAKLSGPWGEGWLFISAEDGTALLREIDNDLLADSNADPIAGITRDEILHCFRAICAITPDLSLEENRVARKSIEYVLPSGWSQRKLDAFFADFHFDEGASISSESIGLAEFARMFSAIQENWRFAGVWAQFQDVDDNGDGMLQIDELRRVVPPGSNKNEVHAWMVRYDQDQKSYISLADFVAIDHAVLQDKLHLALGTAFVLCVYFTHSRVTKALLSVFSMETVEGKLYLKFEVGSPALTNQHIGMMVLSFIYLVLFSFSIPIVALYAMYYSRHNLADRKFATIGGFLTDGYRSKVSWFWEFIVLMRKLVILSISLYVSEPFLQSFSAVVALVLALSLQLYFQPYELFVLNMLETASLASVLMTQLGGILMWYKSLPGRNDNLELFQR